MTKAWPNSLYADGQVSPDPLAFFHPPTQADRVRAHQMVAQSYLGLAFFFGSQALFGLPGVFQSAAGPGFETIVNLVCALCFASAIIGFVISIRLQWKTAFSPNLSAAHKIVAGPKPRLSGWGLAIALIIVAIAIFGFGIMVFRQVNFPGNALGILAVTINLNASGSLTAEAFQQMTRALNIK